MNLEDLELYRQVGDGGTVWIDNQFSDRVCQMDVEMLGTQDAFDVANLFVNAPKMLVMLKDCRRLLQAFEAGNGSPVAANIMAGDITKLLSGI